MAKVFFFPLFWLIGNEVSRNKDKIHDIYWFYYEVLKNDLKRIELRKNGVNKHIGCVTKRARYQVVVKHTIHAISAFHFWCFEEFRQFQKLRVKIVPTKTNAETSSFIKLVASSQHTIKKPYQLNVCIGNNTRFRRIFFVSKWYQVPIL